MKRIVTTYGIFLVIFMLVFSNNLLAMETVIPIDGGISALLIAGAVFGGYKLFKASTVEKEK